MDCGFKYRHLKPPIWVRFVQPATRYTDTKAERAASITTRFPAWELLCCDPAGYQMCGLQDAPAKTTQRVLSVPGLGYHRFMS